MSKQFTPFLHENHYGITIAIMLEKFQQLDTREQRALWFGGLSLFLILAYFLVWEPLLQNRQVLRTQLAEQQQLLHWMQQAQIEVQKLQHKQNVRQVTLPVGMSLLSVVDQSLRQGALQALNKQVQPHGDNGAEPQIAVRFKSIALDTLLQWLASLYNQYGIQAKQLNLERLNLKRHNKPQKKSNQATDNQVKVRLVLSQ